MIDYSTNPITVFSIPNNYSNKCDMRGNCGNFVGDSAEWIVERTPQGVAMTVYDLAAFSSVNMFNIQANDLNVPPYPAYNLCSGGEGPYTIKMYGHNPGVPIAYVDSATCTSEHILWNGFN
jgi:hypothetical protein